MGSISETFSELNYMDLSKLSKKEFEQIYLSQRGFFNNDNSSCSVEDDVNTDTLEPILDNNKAFLKVKNSPSDKSDQNNNQNSISADRDQVQNSLKNLREQIFSHQVSKKAQDPIDYVVGSVRNFLTEEFQDKFQLLNSIFELIISLNSGQKVSDLSPKMYKNLTSLLNERITNSQKVNEEGQNMTSEQDTQTDQARPITKTNSFTQCSEIGNKNQYRNTLNATTRRNNGCAHQCDHQAMNKKKPNRIYSNVSDYGGKAPNRSSISDSSGYTSDMCRDSSKWSNICSQLCVLSRDLVKSQKLLTKKLLNEKRYSHYQSYGHAEVKAKIDPKTIDRPDLLKSKNNVSNIVSQEQDVYYAKLMPGRNLSQMHEEHGYADFNEEEPSEKVDKLVDLLRKLKDVSQTSPEIGSDLVDNLLEFTDKGHQGLVDLLDKLKKIKASSSESKEISFSDRISNGKSKRSISNGRIEKYLDGWHTSERNNEDDGLETATSTSISDSIAKKSDESNSENPSFSKANGKKSCNGVGSRNLDTKISQNYRGLFLPPSNNDGPYLCRRQRSSFRSNTQEAVDDAKSRFDTNKTLQLMKIGQGMRNHSTDRIKTCLHSNKAENFSHLIINTIDDRIKYLFDCIINQLSNSRPDSEHRSIIEKIDKIPSMTNYFPMGYLGPGMTRWICTSIIRRVYQLTRSWIPLKAFQSQQKKIKKTSSIASKFNMTNRNENSLELNDRKMKFRFGWFEKSDLREDFRAYFINQLEEQLKSTIDRYEGKILNECIDQLMQELANILTDELTFYSLMTEKDTNSEPSLSKDFQDKDLKKVDSGIDENVNTLVDADEFEAYGEENSNHDAEEFKSEECPLEYATPKYQVSEEENHVFQNITTADMIERVMNNLKHHEASNNASDNSYQKDENPSYSMKDDHSESFDESSERKVESLRRNSERLAVYLDENKSSNDPSLNPKTLTKSSSLSPDLNRQDLQAEANYQIPDPPSSLYSDLNFSSTHEDDLKRHRHYNNFNTNSIINQERSLEIEDLSLLTIDTMELPTFITSDQNYLRHQSLYDTKVLRKSMRNRKFTIIEETNPVNDYKFQEKLASFTSEQVY